MPSFLEELQKASKELEQACLSQFKGMKVVCDPYLPDGRWYLAVSKDIYWKLEKEKNNGD